MASPDRMDVSFKGRDSLGTKDPRHKYGKTMADLRFLQFVSPIRQTLKSGGKVFVRREEKAALCDPRNPKFISNPR